MCNDRRPRYTSSLEAMNDDDAALARRIAAAPGEAREEEEELARRFAPRIRLYGLRHLRDRDAANDLVQQVLLVTLESLRGGRVREPERLASFILGTCRNVALDLRRGGRRRQALLDRYLVVEDSAEPALPPPARLADCLQRLAERDRSRAGDDLLRGAQRGRDRPRARPRRGERARRPASGAGPPPRVPGGARMTPGCPPPDDPRLLDWWRGDLPDGESDAFEEHLFACERCRHAAEELAGIEAGVRAIVRKGGLGFVPSTSVLERLRRDGVRMRDLPRGAGRDRRLHRRRRGRPRGDPARRRPRERRAGGRLA